MKKLVLVMAMVLVAGVAQAELADYTGSSYDWVAYNNSALGTKSNGIIWDDAHAGWETAVEGNNVTVFTNATNHSGDSLLLSTSTDDTKVASGELIKYADGSGTGVSLSATVNGNVQWLNPHPWTGGVGDDTTPGTAAHTAFSDTSGINPGSNVLGDYGDSGYFASGRPNENTQVFTFSGLNPEELYDFAGIATALVGERGSAATTLVTIGGVDGFVNNSVQSQYLDNGAGGWRLTDYETAGHGNPATEGDLAAAETAYFSKSTTTAYTILSGFPDDMVLFEDIDPGDDGIFTITIETMTGGLVNTLADTEVFGSESGGATIDGFALGMQGAGAIPEPSGLALVALGLIGISRRRK